MESEFYTLLNYLFHPRKLLYMLSTLMLILLPSGLEYILIYEYLQNLIDQRMIFSIEFSSAIFGYVYAYIVIRSQIKKILLSQNIEQIYALVGSFPALLYLLSPGLISLILGCILLSSKISNLFGKKILQKIYIDPSTIYTLLEFNNRK